MPISKIVTNSLANSLSISANTGSASAPAISPTGDTNTGIFFPAADTIAFAEGGVESMRITSNGDVGIGTSSPQAKFHVGSNTTAPGFGTTSEMVYNIGTSQPEFLVRQTGSGVVCSIAADGTGGYVRTATNHPLRFLTNNANQMNLTAAGLLQFNSGYGSVATAYGCRAWAKFDGAADTISGSGNISSISDTGFSTYRANFTNNLVDANYAVVTAGQHNNYAGASLGAGGSNAVGDSNTTSYVALESRDLSNNGNEPNELFFAVFR